MWAYVNGYSNTVSAILYHFVVVVVGGGGGGGVLPLI
jgi:hypothetical protein